MNLSPTTWIRQDAGGEEIETIAKVTNLEDLRLEYCKFNTEIHRFHNIQGEICINTE